MGKRLNTNYWPYAADPWHPKVDEMITVRQLKIAYYERKFHLCTWCCTCIYLGVAQTSAKALIEETFGEFPRMASDLNPTEYEMAQMIRLGMFPEGTHPENVRGEKYEHPLPKEQEPALGD